MEHFKTDFNKSCYPGHKWHTAIQHSAEETRITAWPHDLVKPWPTMPEFDLPKHEALLWDLIPIHKRAIRTELDLSFQEALKALQDWSLCITGERGCHEISF